MTHEEITSIAKRMNKEVQKRIDKEVEERLDILREGDLSEEDMERMEDCLYMSLVLQEFLDGEYDILEEERILLLEDMEELYNEYSGLLVKAKLEEKVSKKKRMALELMRIREQLFNHKKRMKMVNNQIKDNRDNRGKLEDLSNKETMKEVAKNKKDLPNPDKQNKFGLDKDMGVGKGKDKAGISGGSYASVDKRLSDLERYEVRDRMESNDLRNQIKELKRNQTREDIIRFNDANDPLKQVRVNPTVNNINDATSNIIENVDANKKPLDSVVAGIVVEEMNRTQK